MTEFYVTELEVQGEDGTIVSKIVLDNGEFVAEIKEKIFCIGDLHAIAKALIYARENYSQEVKLD